MTTTAKASEHRNTKYKMRCETKSDKKKRNQLKKKRRNNKNNKNTYFYCFSVNN